MPEIRLFWIKFWRKQRKEACLYSISVKRDQAMQNLIYLDLVFDDNFGPLTFGLCRHHFPSLFRIPCRLKIPQTNHLSFKFIIFQHVNSVANVVLDSVFQAFAGKVNILIYERNQEQEE
jgi:hypothetical protein